jgi:hypothetical protein
VLDAVIVVLIVVLFVAPWLCLCPSLDRSERVAEPLASQIQLLRAHAGEIEVELVYGLPCGSRSRPLAKDDFRLSEIGRRQPADLGQFPA